MRKHRKKSFWRQIISFSGMIFNTRVRLAFAMAFVVLTFVMMAQPLGLIPDDNQTIMDARKLQTETLAMSGSAVAEAGGGSLREFQKTLRNTVERSDDLISCGLRKRDDSLVFSVADHDQHWQMPSDGRSNHRFMFVPIHRGGRKIAQLELCYRPLISISAIANSAIAKLAMFLFFGCLVSFNFMLYRTMRQLDPRGAVPKRVREAFDAMAEALLILDRKGNIMMANDKFCGVVGRTADELNGGNIADFEWNSKRDELPWVEAIATTKQVTEAIVEKVDEHQKTKTFSVSVAPVLTAEGACKGLIVTFDDITMLEQHKRELVEARKAADKANEAKSNFLSRMSHEIRTPMNAIIGYTDILQQGETNSDDQLRYLTTIQSSGEHLLSLINDILDLSKIEAGQMTIEQRRIPVIPLVSQVVETLKVKAIENQLYLEFEIDGEIPREIITDETRLRQVLINTVGNAIKFTKEGGVKIIARFQPGDRPMMEFDVEDTGIGISDAALESIFDPFSQADDSVTRNFGGTGLGLAICKQLSESMGGGITATSEEGVGTTFSIRIAAGDVADTTLVSEENKLRESAVNPVGVNTTYQFSMGKVLIVDDGEANRELACLMLKRLGLSTEVAVNGREALEKIAQEKFDVVLMDMHMPVMDGLTATQHARECGISIPIVALTALVTDEEREKCLQRGCSDFLSKPIRVEAMVEVLSKYLPCTTIDTPEKAPTMPASSGDPGAEEMEKSIAQTLASLGYNSETGTASSVTLASAKSELALPETITSSFGNDPAFESIIENFVARLNDRIGEFQIALDNGDWEQLSAHAHWLAGSTGTVGYEQFVDAARELEYSDGSDPVRMQVLVDYLTELTQRIDINQQLPT